ARSPQRLWERPRYLINTVSTKRSRGLGTGSDCPIVCPAVSVFLNPAPRVALKALQPLPSVSRIESRGFVVHKVLTAGLSLLSAQHIFRQLAGRPCHRQIQPGRREYESQLVGHTQSRELSAVAFRPIARMRGCKRSPRLTEKQAHDSCAEFHVRLTLTYVHVGLRNIANVMQAEAGPQPDVPGEAVQFAPGDREEPGVQHSAMRTVQDGSRSNSHRCLRYSRSRPRTLLPDSRSTCAPCHHQPLISPPLILPVPFLPPRLRALRASHGVGRGTLARRPAADAIVMAKLHLQIHRPPPAPPPPAFSEESLTPLDTLRASLNGILWSD